MAEFYEKHVSHWVDVLFNKYYPLTILNKIKCKKRLENKDFSLLVGNCLGGYVYHQLGLPFTSPTINLMICKRSN